MALDISPGEVQFGSVKQASQVWLTLTNKASHAVNYRFRLRSKAISFNKPRGSIDGGKAKKVLVSYDPKMNEIRDILLSMQVKYSEESHPEEEHTKLIAVRFIAEKDMEDDLFKTPMDAIASDRNAGRWWEK